MKKIIPLSLKLSFAFLFITLFPVMANQPVSDQEIDTLISNQKYAEALKGVQEKIEVSKTSRKDREWAKLIVKEAMLKIGLHGYETAVKELRARDWPKDPVAHAMVSLVYARSLQIYGQSYSWEIRKREKISGRESFDLKTMTMDEIYQEAFAGFEKAWKIRDDLGKLKRNELPEIITPNNFPDEVRGTLRDTLTYLISAFLIDTAGWTPEHSNSTYALEVNDLLEKSQKFSLIDVKIHPFRKIAYVLNDLSAWHESKGHNEAALEAKLELYRQMWLQLTSMSAKKKIKESLDKTIARQKSNKWVSMAYATIAEFLRSESEEPKALAMAKAGAALFPKSPGAAKCRDIIRDIELPSLSLEGMNIDTSPRRSLGVNYKNLQKVYFRSFKIDFKSFIRSTKDYSLRPGWRELEPYLKNAPSYKWETDLPATTDYKQHRNFVTPPEHKPGLYAIMVSNKPSFTEGVVHGVEMFMSDYVFQVEKNHEKQEFTVHVMKGSNGEPVKDAGVSLYTADYQNGHKLRSEERSDVEGKAVFTARSFLNTHNAFFFVIEKDGHVVASRNAESMYASGQGNTSVTNAFIYTDRSIYRPEQKILWKIVAYKGDNKEKNYQVDHGQVVTVQLHDANYEIIQKTELKTNRFGTASGEFNVPKGKLLGNWTITSTHGGSVSLKVEEYKRPTFLVEFDEKMAELRLNKDAVIKGKAKYYFGMPLTKGNAKWTVHRQAILPWWCFWGRWNWGSLQSNELVATGNNALGEDGSFEIKFKPAANEDVSDIKDVKYNYQVKADVTDEGGETRSAELSNTIGFSAVTATIVPEDNFFLTGTKAKVTINRTDLNGRALAGKGKWKLFRLKEPAKTFTPSDIPVPKELLTLSKGKLVFPDDMKQPRWDPDFRYDLYLREWDEGETVASGESNHGANGVYELSLPVLKDGAYRIRFETQDSFNTRFDEQKEILVVGKNTRFPLPGLMLVQNSSVEVGGKARLFVMTGFPGQRMHLDSFRGGKMYSRQILVSGKNDTLIEIPITETDRGGLGFALHLLNDYQDIRFSESVMVPWSNKLVDVSFSTFRDKIRPGSKETWSITLRGKNDRKIGPETFELLAYMYDKSLESFGPHSPNQPISIYPTYLGSSFPESEMGPGTQIYTNLSYFHNSHEFSEFTRDQVNFYPNYGIGGMGSRKGFGGSRGGHYEGSMMAKSRSSKLSNDMAMESMADAAAPAMAMAESQNAPGMAEQKKESEQKSEKPAAAVEMRTNFSETAFWKPHLVPGKNGSVSFEFTVPDSVTSWSVWAHAVSKDLQSGSTVKETKTIKELMVRPYLPRFFREGDEAEIRMVINNSSDKVMEGQATFEILDETGKVSLAKEFQLTDDSQKYSVKAGGSTNVTVKVKVPVGPRAISIRTVAKSGNLSDGELRPIPILPGRMHLAESKFVTLINKDKAELTFPTLAANTDKSLVNDLFVVTLDAQLFYSVLSSLPYLVNHPYQSTDQMLNSFVSSGIVTSVFDEFPEVGKMAKDMSSRKTRFEKWDDNDPNRKITLEEAPWLNISRGGNEDNQELISILHPDIAKNTREKYLRLLKNSQTASGGFPWFSGGPPSPWTTLYLLYGFSKAIEFKVTVPKEMIVSAWRYMHAHYINELVGHLMAHDVGWETITFLNYVLSSYPDTSWSGGVFSAAERTTMLNFSMKHWKQHSPYLKSYLALTLHRAKRTSDAKLVWESVMDSAKTSKEEGTHWAQEDRSWLWYNDTIETHALALRTGSELGTKRESLDGMVHWLFLNKKLNHWKSTRATSEVIYSLTHYLKKTKQLGIKEHLSVSMDGKKTEFDFDPAKYTGKKNQIVIPAEKVGPQLLPVKIEKTTPGIAFASATWHYSTEKLPKEAVGDFFKVGRKFFKRVAEKSGMKLIPVKDGDEIQVGDEVEVQLSLSSKHQAEYVHLRDPRAAGFEPIDQVSQHKWDLGIYWYEEIRDNGTNFFFENLPHGQYTFKYRIRAAIAGKFRAGPATIQPLYAPEFVGFSEGHELKIIQQ
ncbi:MAG: alpha-2-macroglobulin family protein [Bdellovibrionota bacterium]